MGVDELMILAYRSELGRSNSKEMFDCLLFLINADNDDNACLHKIDFFLKRNPFSLLSGGLLNWNFSCPCSGEVSAFIGISFCHDKCNIILSHPTNVHLLLELLPFRLSAEKCYFEESDGIPHGKLCTVDSSSRFSKICFYLEPFTCTANFTILLDTIAKRVTLPRCVQSIPGILTMVCERPDIIMLFTLLAIKNDSISDLKYAMQLMKFTSVCANTTRYTGSMYLTFDEELKTPYSASYLSSGKPSGLNLLRYRLAKHLGLQAKLRPRKNSTLSDLWVDLPEEKKEEEKKTDNSLVRVRLQVPLILFMLYTSSISPKVYNYWISNLPPACLSFSPKL